MVKVEGIREHLEASSSLQTTVLEPGFGFEGLGFRV